MENGKLTIKEAFGDDVEQIVAYSSKNKRKFFTIHKGENLRIIKEEFGIEVEGSLKDLCDELNIDYNEDEH